MLAPAGGDCGDMKPIARQSPAGTKEARGDEGDQLDEAVSCPRNP